MNFTVCVLCQQKQEADKKAADKAAAEAAEEAAEERREATVARISQLLAEFRSRPFVGAKPRPWFEKIDKGPKFLSGGHRVKFIEHSDQPALPIGKLRWTYYFKRSHPDRDERQQSAMLDTGLSAAGEFVLMDVEKLHSRHGNYGYELAQFQEEAICAALEALLAKMPKDL